MQKIQNPKTTEEKKKFIGQHMNEEEWRRQ